MYMTESEKITEQYFGKFFLPQYTFGTVKMLEGKQETELCDCLIETGNCYVVIQIKEKSDENSGTKTDVDWFKKTVLKKAKQQIKNTIRDLKKVNVTYFCDKTEIVIDNKKEILPVIVFFNDNIETYDKLYYSEGLQTYINVFNKSDYQTMLDTIKTPTDIVRYLKQRKILVPKEGGSRYISNDLSVSLCETEEDYAKYYLRNAYGEISNYENRVIVFNKILFDLNKNMSCSRNALIETMLCLDVSEIINVTEVYSNIIENINIPNLAKPKLLTNGEWGVMLLRRPVGMKEVDFVNFLSDMGAYYTYVAKLKICNAIIFEPTNTGLVTIKGALSEMCYKGYDEQLETLKKEIEMVSWNSLY